jgi:hypothetical protein
MIMKNANYFSRALSKLHVVMFMLVAAAVAAAQTQSWTGKYEGTAKGPNGDVKVSLNLVEDAGKFSGEVTTPKGTYKIVKGQMKDGTLTLDVEGNGAAAKMTLQAKEGKLFGELTADGKTGAIELQKAMKDNTPDVWDGAADAQGQAFPFTLTLKLDGEKVTGGSSSQLGEAPISTGTFKDGKLSFVLEGGSGQIVMSATLTDGKLIGDYDFAGQSSGKWVATRKP